jgi:rubrerythrin
MNDKTALAMQPDWSIKTDLRLLAAIERAAKHQMSEAEIDAQRRSWVRAMTPSTRRERAKASALTRDVSDKSTALRGYLDQRLAGGSLKAGSEAERDYRCPYSNGLVREVRIEWPCPACGADFGDEPARCLDRKSTGPRVNKEQKR